jgi:hypothetical protein
MEKVDFGLKVVMIEKLGTASLLRAFKNRRSEPVFVNVYGAQESIPPGCESIPGLLRRFTKTVSGP